MAQTFMLFSNSSLQLSIYTISCESRENNPSRQLKKNEKKMRLLDWDNLEA